SPDRNFQHHVIPGLAATVGAFSVASALRVVLGIEAEVDQRVVCLARLHDDVAPAATVAARGAAARDELLHAECNAAIAAVAGLYADFRFIDEHRESVSSSPSQLPQRLRRAINQVVGV